ncbi:hypothetical protein [Agromyces kandeliae]|uniref:Uncharacterized protein n=1 Tax=Agromyces kandeliae TaxID=2666141 RepID=A0A6L5QZW7_9MICO|nr:hypothetical protein [Agromyces kandeliae]MRX43356.1 hypothetical protein [Agromyces kandeliae]
MKRIMLAGAAAVALAIGMASPAAAAPPECNWGEATSDFVAAEGGQAQGAHAADPSGDGRGPESRVGLPNLDPSAEGQGKLVATCLIVTGG